MADLQQEVNTAETKVQAVDTKAASWIQSHAKVVAGVLIALAALVLVHFVFKVL